MEWQRERRIYGVIFDMDGTLVDSEPIHCIANRDAFEHFGLARDLYQPAEFIGVPDVDTFQLFIDKYHFSFTAQDMLAVKIVRMKRLCETMLTLTSGAEDVLKAVRSAGLRVGVATASSRQLLEFFVERLGIGHYFDALASGTDPDVAHNKPAPDVFLRCAEKIGVSPLNAVVFEDSHNGVRAALAAGTDVIVIRGAENKDKDFSSLPVSEDWANGFAGYTSSPLFSRIIQCPMKADC